MEYHSICKEVVNNQICGRVKQIFMSSDLDDPTLQKLKCITVERHLHMPIWATRCYFLQCGELTQIPIYRDSLITKIAEASEVEELDLVSNRQRAVHSTVRRIVKIQEVKKFEARFGFHDNGRDTIYPNLNTNEYWSFLFQCWVLGNTML